MRLIIVAVLALAAAIACYAAWRQLRKPAGSNERFDVRRTDADADADADAGRAGGDEKPHALSSYEKRMIALDAFRTVVGRRPTEDEIEGLVRLNRTEAEIRSAIAARKRDDSDSDSDDSDDDDCSDDDSDHGKNKKRASSGRRPKHEDESKSGSKRIPGGKDKECGGGAPEPYAPDRVHKDCEASPNGSGWLDGGRAGDGVVGDARRICLDRMDIMRRLEAIGREVDQFRQFVAML